LTSTDATEPLIDAYNKIHNPKSGEHQFQFYQQLGAEAFKQSKLELEQIKLNKIN
jgi:hypothetical protein